LTAEKHETALAVGKFYGSVSDPAWRGAVTTFISGAIAQLPPLTYRFTINYGKPTKYSPETLDAVVSTLMDLEQALVISTGPTSGVALTALLANRQPKLLYEICIFWLTEDRAPLFSDKAAAVLPYFEIAYGYGRMLATDAAPLSESRPKRSWFGTSFHVDPGAHDWMVGLTHEAPVKGIYPFNVLLSSALTNTALGRALRSVGINRATTMDQRLQEIALDEQTLARIRETCPELHGYIRS